MSIYGNWMFGPMAPNTGLAAFPAPPLVRNAVPRQATAPIQRPAPAFVWGPNGQKADPSQRAAQVDTSPVGHWLEGAARIGQAYSNAMQERQQQFPSVPGGGSLTLGSILGFNSGGLY